MDSGLSALIGMIIGSGTTLWATTVQRRWQRKDRTRDLIVSRGEELLDQCQQLVEWKETVRKVAFTDEGQGFVPPQAPMYRIAAIVELFFPELVNQSRSLDCVVLNYLHNIRGIAQLLHAGNSVSELPMRELRDEQERLEQALGLFLEAARKLIRERMASAK